MPDVPVERIPTATQEIKPQPGVALCLSSGGDYRAMLFHVGALWRLYEACLLKDVKRISSVSGGAITAGVLALKWRELSFDPALVNSQFVPSGVSPTRKRADETLAVHARLPSQRGESRKYLSLTRARQPACY